MGGHAELVLDGSTLLVECELTGAARVGGEKQGHVPGTRARGVCTATAVVAPLSIDGSACGFNTGGGGREAPMGHEIPAREGDRPQSHRRSTTLSRTCAWHDPGLARFVPLNPSRLPKPVAKDPRRRIGVVRIYARPSSARQAAPRPSTARRATPVTGIARWSKAAVSGGRYRRRPATWCR